MSLIVSQYLDSGVVGLNGNFCYMQPQNSTIYLTRAQIWFYSHNIHIIGSKLCLIPKPFKSLFELERTLSYHSVCSCKWQN